jgi:hypothetical protein
MSAQRCSPDERPKGGHAFRAVGGGSGALAGPIRAMGGGRRAAAAARRVCVRAAGHRSPLSFVVAFWAMREDGQEARAPPARVLAELPRITLGKRGRSGAVREPPRVRLVFRGKLEVVRPPPAEVLRKPRALRQVARDRAQQAPGSSPSLPKRDQQPARSTAPGAADAERPPAAPTPSDAPAARTPSRGARGHAPRAHAAPRTHPGAPLPRRPGPTTQRPARNASASRNCWPLGVPTPVTSS